MKQKHIVSFRGRRWGKWRTRTQRLPQETRRESPNRPKPFRVIAGAAVDAPRDTQGVFYRFRSCYTKPPSLEAPSTKAPQCSGSAECTKRLNTARPPCGGTEACWMTANLAILPIVPLGLGARSPPDLHRAAARIHPKNAPGAHAHALHTCAWS